VKKKLVFIAAGVLSISGLGIMQSRPAYSATCSKNTVLLSKVIATGPIPISLGLKFFPVNNPTPLITGMRIRAVSGTTSQTAKYVEGRIGSISNCSIAIRVDRLFGTGTVTNARFTIAGEIGAQGKQGLDGDPGESGERGEQGPNGETGESGEQGEQGLDGETGAQGEQGPNGANGLNGQNGRNGINGLVPAYGSFRDTTTQQVESINTPKAMTFNRITPGVNGVSAKDISVEFNSRITVTRTGAYSIHFSAQVTKIETGNDIMDIWLRRNGVDVPLSNSEITITASLRQVATSNYIIDLAAGDYVELMYSSADIATRILAIAPGTSPTRPAGPSITVAITQVQ
jgi:hypothetical protein